MSRPESESNASVDGGFQPARWGARTRTSAVKAAPTQGFEGAALRASAACGAVAKISGAGPPSQIAGAHRRAARPAD
eukprot:3142484-Pyramimonas_sp.AAC.1